MKILLTGATGYIAQRLLPVLLENGHEVICCVRDANRFNTEKYASYNLKVIQVNFLDKETLKAIPDDIDAAYYLIHSMSTTGEDFKELEETTALHFRERIGQTAAKQVIYLSGIINEQKLSKHLESRKKVEEVLSQGTYALTTLRAGIIVGSGSASFEIIRDLVEKLPVMITPRWVETLCQPIAIRNVIEFLYGVLLRGETYKQSFDIGGPDIMSYKQMLLQFAAVRKLKRRIFVVPVMTPRLSSYWLYFVTSTSYALAVNLVDSMKVEVVCKENKLKDLLGINLINYKRAIALAFDKIEQDQVLSSWKDALTSNTLYYGISKHMEIPVNGCFKDKRSLKIADSSKVLKRIWAIGGSNGWYYGNWLWGIRGHLDKLAGGVGLRRGRKHPTEISAGDTLDFWRVLLASKTEKRLLLYAEMRLPGEAWLEFKINSDNVLEQTATFRPLGIAGRLYWYAVLPFHGFIFRGMIRNIAAESRLATVT
ncbi:SDR family oxidoreductase [Segetibacter sp. 3557_3]|uniref:SDR family oxidoreductase n=1 Tax=Segetibacter sp. 3557_3 TaxID=2547429 RepID=UPI0010587752|nr:SDR family oxidoreductase [Segetibacter sp. 3557_3]TDH27949.1 SDR family oxidoreductase [Segetibacter sp. 3557_3]